MSLCTCGHDALVHDSDWGDGDHEISCAVEGCQCEALKLDPSLIHMAKLYLDGVEVTAFVRDGYLCVEVDTYADGAPAIHEADGTPRLKIHVNDGAVWPRVECSCGMERRSDLHSGDCATVRS